VSSGTTISNRPRLLGVARSLLHQVNSAGSVVENWSLGGGTALMLRIDHRESRDIDIFLSDAQHLAFLDPAKRDFRFEVAPSGELSDGSRFLKLAFSGLGEIDFIVAEALTTSPETSEMIESETLSLETVPEIIAKKIYHQGFAIKPRCETTMRTALARTKEVLRAVMS
jgi:Nucleotidyl transferase AbiEii toxin, Type IV TA system